MEGRPFPNNTTEGSVGETIRLTQRGGNSFETRPLGGFQKKAQKPMGKWGGRKFSPLLGGVIIKGPMSVGKAGKRWGGEKKKKKR